jgi:hypothetical protein
MKGCKAANLSLTGPDTAQRTVCALGTMSNHHPAGHKER